MTVLALALAVVACIGWTLHARVLHRALREAWAEIDALGDRDPVVASAAPIDDLVTEFGIRPLAPADYQRERAELERQFLAKHGTHAEGIDVAIGRGVLPCGDPIVEAWVALQALAPYPGSGMNPSKDLP